MVGKRGISIQWVKRKYFRRSEDKSVGVRFLLHADELAAILLFRLELLSDAPHFDERQRCSYRNQTAEDNEHNEVHLRRPLLLKNMTQAGALRRDPRRRVPRRHDSAEPEPARHA